MAQRLVHACASEFVIILRHVRATANHAQIVHSSTMCERVCVLVLLVCGRGTNKWGFYILPFIATVSTLSTGAATDESLGCA